MDVKIMKKLLELVEKNIPVALVTVTAKTGSGPRGAGSMMLVDKKGNLITGTVGGGSVEEQAKKDAMSCLGGGISKSFTYELNLSEHENSLQMVCGGVVEVFIKAFPGNKRLIIAGAGHVGRALGTLAGTLGYSVEILDSRPEYANRERFPDVSRVEAGSINELLRNTSLDNETYVVIATHGHVHDIDALEAVIGRKAGYVGMIGSRSKVKYCLDDMRDRGFTEEEIKAVHAPIGLDIGGDTPEEIALSIMAEIQAVRNGKKAGFMKDGKKDANK